MLSSNVKNGTAVLETDFVEDTSLLVFNWKQNDLLKYRSQKSPDLDDENLSNKFALDSPDESIDDFDSEDEHGEDADNALRHLSYTTSIIQNMMIHQTMSQMKKHRKLLAL